jgi:hypothetical protein
MSDEKATVTVERRVTITVPAEEVSRILRVHFNAPRDARVKFDSGYSEGCEIEWIETETEAAPDA